METFKVQVAFLIAKGVRVTGDETPRATSFGTYQFPLSRLLNRGKSVSSIEILRDTYDINPNEKHDADLYIIPARHIHGSIRPYMVDVEEYPEQFLFSVIPFDFDLLDKDGERQVVGDKTTGNLLIKSFVEDIKTDQFLRQFCCCVTSKRGIRVLYAFDKEVGYEAWAKIRQLLVDRFDAMLAKEGDKYKLVPSTGRKYYVKLDKQGAVSLTRVPYSYRGHDIVHNEDYFAWQSRRKFYQINTKMALAVAPDVITRKTTIKGYTHAEYDAKKPTKLQLPPEGIASAGEWYNDPPDEGGRDNGLFIQVANTVRFFRDRYTPEEYYFALHNLLNEIDVEPEGLKHWEEVLWSMICRSYIRRVKSDGKLSAIHDPRQIAYSGGKPMFAAKEYDECVEPAQLMETLREKYKEYRLTLLEQPHKSAIYFNPPPGAGKSTICANVMRERDEKGLRSLYLAPDREHVRTMAERLFERGCEPTIIYSYGQVIQHYANGDEDLYEYLKRQHDRYLTNRNKAEKACDDAMKQFKELAGVPGIVVNLPSIFELHVENVEAEMFVIRNNYVGVASFPTYLANKELLDESLNQDLVKMAKEIQKLHDRPLESFIKNQQGTYLMTMAKYKTMVHREGAGIASRHEDMQVFIDECQPEDLFDPLMLQEDMPRFEVYGAWHYANFNLHTEKAIEQQHRLAALLRTVRLVCINADKGLEYTMASYGYPPPDIVGRDLPPVLDLDLEFQFVSSLSANKIHSKLRKNSAVESVRTAVIREIRDEKPEHTLICNGKDGENEALSENNIVTATGSNAFIASNVVSIISQPHPSEIATACAMMGTTDAKKVERLLVQNKVNQMVSRNTGYRAKLVCDEISRANGEGGLKDNENEHICVLPESYRDADLDLIVRTSKVGQEMVKKKNHSPETICRIVLSQVVEGERQTFRDLVTRCRRYDRYISRREYGRILKKISGTNPTLTKQKTAVIKNLTLRTACKNYFESYDLLSIQLSSVHAYCLSLDLNCSRSEVKKEMDLLSEKFDYQKLEKRRKVYYVKRRDTFELKELGI